jgi:hypothetical protein
MWTEVWWSKTAAELLVLILPLLSTIFNEYCEIGKTYGEKIYLS